MLFATGDLEELEEANATATLPVPASPTTIEPPPPDVLAPGATWRATISAPRLARRRQLGPRLVRAASRRRRAPPKGMQPAVVWITDRSHRL